jgi:hypothetical protein
VDKVPVAGIEYPLAARFELSAKALFCLRA